MGGLVAFEDVLAAAKELPYREKLKLATKLLQLAAKEEEQAHPEGRAGNPAPRGEDLTAYVGERLHKLRPSKRSGVENAIVAMFQFQGGISDEDVNVIIADLMREQYLSFDGTRVVYPTTKA